MCTNGPNWMGRNTAGAQRPHLLYLAFWYPPSRASGVYRAIATTSAFTEAGWHVTVITVDREFLEDEVGSVDTSLESQDDECVHITRIPFTLWPSAGADLRSVGWLAGNFPQIMRLNSRGATLPDKYHAWIAPTVARAVDIAKKRPFDHVLATGNPYSSFEAARLIADRLDIGYSLDFRDPWTIDVFTGSRVGDARTWKMEDRIIHDASACFHVNQPIATAYADIHPTASAKQLVAPNGFDSASLGPVRTPSSSGPLTFGVLGTVTDRWPLQALDEGWQHARPDLPAGSEFVIAGHLGYFAHSSQPLHTTLSAAPNIRYAGPVQKSQVSDFYRSLDVVVVPVPGGPLVTSGKIYEAMALGIPLVCIQREGGGARELVKNHPMAYAAEPRAASIAASLLDAAAAGRTMTLSDVADIRASMGQYERARALSVIVDTVTNSI